MNKLLILCLLVLAAGCNESTSDSYASNGSDSTSKADTSKKSIPSEAKKWVGNTEIRINYHSPGVRGRTIWGGLVPYNEVWVTGAHKATTLEIGKSFRVAGKDIPAGKYALFTIPGKDTWTIIVNSNWDQHLADEYSEKEDMVRVNVEPKVEDTVRERLKYEIDQKGERLADIIISWEKIRVVLPIEVL